MYTEPIPKKGEKSRQFKDEKKLLISPSLLGIYYVWNMRYDQNVPWIFTFLKSIISEYTVPLKCTTQPQHTLNSPTPSSLLPSEAGLESSPRAPCVIQITAGAAAKCLLTEVGLVKTWGRVLLSLLHHTGTVKLLALPQSEWPWKGNALNPLRTWTLSGPPSQRRWDTTSRTAAESGEADGANEFTMGTGGPWGDQLVATCLLL